MQHISNTLSYCYSLWCCVRWDSFALSIILLLCVLYLSVLSIVIANADWSLCYYGTCVYLYISICYCNYMIYICFLRSDFYVMIYCDIIFHNMRYCVVLFDLTQYTWVLNKHIFKVKVCDLFIYRYDHNIYTLMMSLTLLVIAG